MASRRITSIDFASIFFDGKMKQLITEKNEMFNQFHNCGNHRASSALI